MVPWWVGGGFPLGAWVGPGRKWVRRKKNEAAGENPRCCVRTLVGESGKVAFCLQGLGWLPLEVGKLLGLPERWLTNLVGPATTAIDKVDRVCVLSLAQRSIK